MVALCSPLSIDSVASSRKVRLRTDFKVEFIVTGYPALEDALRAISSQVEVKPMDAPKMVAAIEQRLRVRKPTVVIQTKRPSSILHDKTDQICQRIIVEM